MIEINNLVKSYGKRTILAIDELKIGKGEVIGLIGNNGAGKTTLMRLIVGYIKPTAGECLVCGKSSVTDLQCSNRVALINEKMKYSGDTSLMGIIQDYKSNVEGFDSDKMTEYLTYFNLDKKSKFGKLSKGMTNIFNMIIGFCLPNEIILFDEITSGVDEYARMKFNEILIREIADRNKTYILSTHLFGEIANIVERIILIKDGKIALDEDVDKVGYYLITLRATKENLEPLLEGSTIYSNKEAGKYSEVVMRNNLTRQKKSYIEDNGIECEATPISEACALIANIEPRLKGERNEKVL